MQLWRRSLHRAPPPTPCGTSHALSLLPCPTQGQAQLEAAREGKTSRYVLMPIWLTHYPRLLAAMSLQCFYSGVQFAGPLMLNQIVRYITKPVSQQTVSAS